MVACYTMVYLPARKHLCLTKTLMCAKLMDVLQTKGVKHREYTTES